MRRPIAKIATTFACALPVSASQPALAAYGYCSQPSAPSSFLHKPMKPFCAASQNCSQWEVDMYRNEVDSYFRSLKSYLADVDTYYDDAYTYAKCMADLD